MEVAMKKLALFAVVLGFAFVTLAAQSGKLNVEAEKAKVRLVLETYVKALEAEDLEQLLRLFVRDDDLATVNVMTPGISLGQKHLKAATEGWFNAVKDIDLTVKNETIKVSSAGDAAWISFTLDGSHSYPNQPGRYDYKDMRATWGMEKRKGRYLIVQGHWSFVCNDRND
jgi:ketosteroid isomerase-like protein